ncbi:MAG: hypothetical protein EA403_10070 [Spirochaetaceae bacterium]|nr:MAG: hypothetical protein EA403_10070 [Spirochaetaceae bacterium]
MKGRIGAWIFLVFSAALFVAMVYTVGDYLRHQRITRTMRDALGRIDRLIDEGSYARASQEILATAEHTGSSGSWVRLIRRAWTVSERVGEYTVMATVAVAAAESLPGNTQLAALAVFAQLRTGDQAAAREAAERAVRSLRDQERYASLVAEAMLRTGRRGDAAIDGSSELWQLTLLGPESPASSFRAAAEMTGDPRYAVSALVRAMEEGDRESALDILGDERIARTAPRTAAFAAFDLQEHQRFVRYLALMEGREGAGNEILMMNADLLMSAGDYRGASRVYDEIAYTLRSQPQPAVLPVNRAWLADRQVGDSRSATAILAEAHAQTPGEWLVTRELALSLADERPDEARSVLASAAGDRGAIAQLLEERLFSPVRQPAVGANRLWLLLGRHGHDDEIARYLAWFVAGLRSVSELETVLDGAETARADSDIGAAHEPHAGWVAFYRGVVAVGRDRPEEALQWFSTAAEVYGDWHAAIAATRLALQLGRSDRAEEMITRAERLGALRPGSVSDQVTVAALRAAVLADRGDFAEAGPIIRDAVQRDPTNPHARAVSRFLETR